MHLRTSILLFLLALALPVSAQVYEIRDASGRVIGYSDTPPDDGNAARRIEVSTPNSAAPPPAVPRPTADSGIEAPGEALPSYELAITSPANETGIPMGGGNFDVQARSTPALRAGHKLQLRMDGEPWGEPQSSGNWALTNVFRGAHDLTVEALDASGERLATSEPIRVYVQRPSVISRARRAGN